MTRTFFALDNHLDTGRWRVRRFISKAARDEYCLATGATPINSIDARIILGQNRFTIAGERYWHADDEAPGSLYADAPERRMR